MNFVAHQPVRELRSVWPSPVQARGPPAKHNGLLEECTRAEHPLAAVQLGGQVRSKVTVFPDITGEVWSAWHHGYLFQDCAPETPAQQKGNRKTQAF